MQNKPNFQKSQMNVSISLQTAYENISDWTLGQNKPNSNPIKPNSQKAQMNINSLITKDYRKKDDFAVRKNKPNSNPISEKPKMSANAFLQKDYDNETAFRPQQNKPKQTQWIKRIRSIFRRFILIYFAHTPQIDTQTPIFSSNTRISSQNQKKNLKNPNFTPLWKIFVMAFVNIGC